MKRKKKLRKTHTPTPAYIMQHLLSLEKDGLKKKNFEIKEEKIHLYCFKLLSNN